MKLSSVKAKGLTAPSAEELAVALNAFLSGSGEWVFVNVLYSATGGAHSALVLYST